jgi:acetyl esterase/lipase
MRPRTSPVITSPWIARTDRQGHGLVLGRLHHRLRQRAENTASPLLATLDDLAGLPPAFVIVDGNDALRDEGEAYARRLTAADVPTTSVRCNCALHDFMALDPVRGTWAARAATAQAVAVLRGALHSGTEST